MSEPINFFDPDVRANPFPTYARLRQGPPVQQIQPGGFWAVSRAEDIEFVFKNTQIFQSSGFEAIFKPDWLPHNPLGDSMLVKDGPAHTKLRALVSRAFTPRTIARLEPQIRAICVEVAEHLAAVRETDFVDALSARVPGLAMIHLLGLDRKLFSELNRWVNHIIAVSPIYPGDELADAIRASIRELEGYLQKVILARRSAPCEDTVSDLIAAEGDGQTLSDEEIVAFLILLIVAGFESTKNFLSFALLDFDRRPEVFTQLREDPKLIPAYVEELLRIESPVHGIFRITGADTELGGVKLPRGSMVMLLIASGNRDASRFPEPDRFDAQRGSQAGLAFGYGAHFCLGAALTRLEARCMLEELTARFVRLEKLPGEIQWNIAVHARGPVRLPFRVIPASP